MTIQSGADLPNSIRPWDFVLSFDDSVRSLAVPSSEDDHNRVYPARYRIPPATIEDLDEGERVKRAELFALGSILYEIWFSRKPFEELSDVEVQIRYSNANVPEDVTTLSQGPVILSCWSVEFARELYQIVGQSLRLLIEQILIRCRNEGSETYISKYP
jgi:hypothetical protein